MRLFSQFYVNRGINMNGLKLVVFFAVMAIVSSKTVEKRDVDHHHSDACDNSISTSDGFKEKWASVTKGIKSYLRSEKSALVAVNIFERSICANCVEKKLLKLNLTEKFDTLSSKIDNLDEIEKIQLGSIYAGTGILCSNKVRPIQEFVFDLIMSFGHLIRAFKDEPELKEYFFFLRCANSYVIRKNYWDNTEYSINNELDEDEKFQCKNFSDEIEKTIKEQIEDSSDHDDSECSKAIIEKTIPFVMRTILLAQVDLTPKQLEEERERFFKKEKELNEKSMKCFFSELFEIDVDTLNNIKGSAQFRGLGGRSRYSF